MDLDKSEDASMVCQTCFVNSLQVLLPKTLVMKPSSVDPVPIPYKREAVKQKQIPAAGDVKSWLAWRGNTIRDLARSIREDGRAKAFPILADALEEAGCTNEDLLNACRSGDPDIDGAWVLTVLLGK